MNKAEALALLKEYNKEEPEFPCVVKPSDSYSAKGISVCRNKEEYSSAVEFALSFSKKKEILVEKYMDCSFVECVNIEYLIMDGEIKLVAVGDKYVLRQGSKAPITASVLYPSIHTEEFANSDVDINTQKMFKSLNMKNGMVYIESFYDEEGFHFYEMGYRLGGGQSSVLMKEVKNADYLQMIINYALTQKMCEKEDFDKIDYKVEKSCCGMVLHLSAGRVEKIIDSIGDDKAIIRKTFFVKEGEEVHRKFVGTLGQTFARIHIVCENRNLLIKKMEEVYEKVKALNKNGENMIVPFEMGLIKR